MHYKREEVNLKIINVEINDSVASVDNRNVGPAGSVNNVQLVFTFSEEWGGFDKRVVFINAQQETPTYQLIENDMALITANALKYDGIIYFGVTGTKIVDGELVEKTLSKAENLEVSKSVDGGTVNPPLDPDLYAQMQARIEATELIAQAAAELTAEVQAKLDDGEFNGKSAYEIAVINGFIGTDAEWLISLNGEDATNPNLTFITNHIAATETPQPPTITGTYPNLTVTYDAVSGATGNTGATGTSGIYPETHITAATGAHLSSYALDPNRLYIFENAVSSALTLTFNAPTANCINEYLFIFTVSGTPVITLPISSGDWQNGIPPFATGKRYLISAIKDISTTYAALWGGR